MKKQIKMFLIWLMLPELLARLGYYSYSSSNCPGSEHFSSSSTSSVFFRPFTSMV